MKNIKIISVLKGLVVAFLLFEIYWPVVNQDFLLSTVSLCTAYFSFNAFRNKRYVWSCIYLSLTLLFNPVQQITVSNLMWILIYTVTAMLNLVDIFSVHFLSLGVNERENEKTSIVKASLENISTSSYLPRVIHEDPVKEAIYLINLALAYSEQNKREEAESLLKHAVSMWDKADSKTTTHAPLQLTASTKFQTQNNVKDVEDISMETEVQGVLNASLKGLPSSEELLNQKDVKEIISSNIKEVQDLINEEVKEAVSSSIKGFKCSKDILFQSEVQESIETNINELKKLVTKEVKEALNTSIRELVDPKEVLVEKEVQEAISTNINELKKLINQEIKEAISADVKEFRDVREVLMQKEVQEAISSNIKELQGLLNQEIKEAAKMHIREFNSPNEILMQREVQEAINNNIKELQKLIDQEMQLAVNSSVDELRNPSDMLMRKEVQEVIGANTRELQKLMNKKMQEAISSSIKEIKAPDEMLMEKEVQEVIINNTNELQRLVNKRIKDVVNNSLREVMSPNEMLMQKEVQEVIINNINELQKLMNKRMREAINSSLKEVKAPNEMLMQKEVQEVIVNNINELQRLVSLKIQEAVNSSVKKLETPKEMLMRKEIQETIYRNINSFKELMHEEMQKNIASSMEEIKNSEKVLVRNRAQEVSKKALVQENEENEKFLPGLFKAIKDFGANITTPQEKTIPPSNNLITGPAPTLPLEVSEQLHCIHRQLNEQIIPDAVSAQGGEEISSRMVFKDLPDCAGEIYRLSSVEPKLDSRVKELLTKIYEDLTEASKILANNARNPKAYLALRNAEERLRYLFDSTKVAEKEVAKPVSKPTKPLEESVKKVPNTLPEGMVEKLTEIYKHFEEVIIPDIERIQNGEEPNWKMIFRELPLCARKLEKLNINENKDLSRIYECINKASEILPNDVRNIEAYELLLNAKERLRYLLYPEQVKSIADTKIPKSTEIKKTIIKIEKEPLETKSVLLEEISKHLTYVYRRLSEIIIPEVMRAQNGSEPDLTIIFKELPDCADEISEINLNSDTLESGVGETLTTMARDLTNASQLLANDTKDHNAYLTLRNVEDKLRNLLGPVQMETKPIEVKIPVVIKTDETPINKPKNEEPLSELYEAMPIKFDLTSFYKLVESGSELKVPSTNEIKKDIKLAISNFDQIEKGILESWNEKVKARVYNFLSEYARNIRLYFMSKNMHNEGLKWKSIAESYLELV